MHIEIHATLKLKWQLFIFTSLSPVIRSHSHHFLSLHPVIRSHSHHFLPLQPCHKIPPVITWFSSQPADTVCLLWHHNSVPWDEPMRSESDSALERPGQCQTYWPHTVQGLSVASQCHCPLRGKSVKNKKVSLNTTSSDKCITHVLVFYKTTRE